MTKESCSNRTVWCPICLCEYLYTCIFFFSNSLYQFCKYSYCTCPDIGREGTLQYEWCDWAGKAVSGCYTCTDTFPSLMWKSVKVDKLSLPCLNLWSLLHCLSTVSDSPPVPQLKRLMDTRETEENCRDRHRHTELETMEESFQTVHICIWGQNLAYVAGGEDWQLQHHPRLMLHIDLLVA